MGILDIMKEAYDIRNGIKTDIFFDDIQNNVPILFSGNRSADIMIIARDLGEDEVYKKKPLIGRSGQIFRKLIEHLNWKGNFYITNLVPYKPTGNKPFPVYIRNKFLPVLQKQIKLVQPKVILTVGNEATRDVFNESFSGLKKYIKNYLSVKGYKNQRVVSQTDYKCHVLPMVHPSYIIRQGISENNILNKLEIPEMLYFYVPMKLASILI